MNRRLVLGAITVALAAGAAWADQRADAVLLVNSASDSYADAQHFIRPYLDNFGVPYTVLDIATTPVGSDIGNYALIIVGHRRLDINHSLDATEQANISAAVQNGAGLVNFDNDLSPDGTAARYLYVQSIFGFGYVPQATGANVSFPASAPTQYITSRHTAGEVITTGAMGVAGIVLSGTTISLADVPTANRPLLAATTYGQGRAVQWGSYDWMSVSVKGPVYGLDDLVWRSLVWAARKPFVMQGLPNFLTMRVDDVQGGFSWVQIANEFGLKPWLGLFYGAVSDGDATTLSALVNGGQATASVHARSYSEPIYFNHSAAADFADAVVTANFNDATAWHVAHQVPIAKFVVPHYYEFGTNVFAGLHNWGVEFVGTQMTPGLAYGASWLQKGPYRLYETGSSSANVPGWYADYLSIPGHPEYDSGPNRFFNCVTEIRDDAGYEWYPDSNDIPGTIARGTRQTIRAFNSMALATLFTHEVSIQPFAPTSWRSALSGITSNLASYNPLYVTMDYACQYVRATRTSDISTSVYSPESRRVATSLTGTADIPTKFYVFSSSGATIAETLVDAPAFSGSTQVAYRLPGPVDFTINCWDPAHQLPILTTTTDPNALDAGDGLWTQLLYTPARSYPAVFAAVGEPGLPTMRFYASGLEAGIYEVRAKLYTNETGRNMRYFYGYQPNAPDAFFVDTVGGAGGTEQFAEYSLGMVTITDGAFNIYVRDAALLSGSYPFFGWATVRLIEQPGPLDHIVVTPASASVAAGGTRQFAAQGYDAGGLPISGLTYSWNATAGGTIDQTGLFTAGATAGTFTNNVAASSGGVTGYASASVTALPLEFTINCWEDSHQDPVLLTTTDPDALSATDGQWTELLYTPARPYPAVFAAVGEPNLPTMRFYTSGVNAGTYEVRAKLYTGDAGRNMRYFYGYQLNAPDAFSVDTVGGSGGTEQFTEYSLGTVTITDGAFNIYVHDAALLSGAYPFFGWATIRLLQQGPGPLHHITITPGAASVPAGGTRQFSAQGYDASGNAITGLAYAWTTTAGGTINQTGLFSAGSTPGAFTNNVVATSGGVTGYASASVVVGPLHHITITPGTASVPAGGTRQFSAQGYDAGGNAISGLTYLWAASAGGTIDQTGLFSAGSTPGTFTNNISASSGGVTGYASGSVVGVSLDHIVITPGAATLPAGKTLQFSAQGYDASENAIPGLTYVWAATAGGTINQTGLFTAGATLGTFTNNVVVSSAGVSGYASASITAATIGATGDGAVADVAGANYLNVFRYQAASNLTATLMRVRIAATASGRMKLGIYADNSGTPGAFLRGTEEKSSVATGWQTFNLTAPYSFTQGTYYWLAVWTDNNAYTIWATSESNACTYVAATYAASWPSSFPSGSARSGFRYSLYASVNDVAGPVDHIGVSPATASVPAGKKQRFTAQGYDVSGIPLAGLTYTWTTTAGGTIDQTGLFTAGSTPGSFANNVVASSGGASGYASTNIAGSVASIVVAPSAANVQVGRTLQFTAQGYDATGHAISGLTFAWAATGGGTIDQNGVFTAGATPGTFTNNVSASNGGVTGYASASVVSRTLDHIVITPGAATVPAGKALQFSAQGYDASDNALAGLTYTWSVTGGGTIAQTGLFTAGATPGTFTDNIVVSSGGVIGNASASITAATLGYTGDGAVADAAGANYLNAFRYQAASNLTATLMRVRISASSSGRMKLGIYADNSGTPGAFLRGTEEKSSVATGWQVFNLTAPYSFTQGAYYWLAVWTDNNAYTIWAASESNACTYVAATYAASWPSSFPSGSARSGFRYSLYASVNDVAGPIDHIGVSPATANVPPGKTQRFTAQGYDASGIPLAGLTYTWTTTAGGTIDQTGLFTAGPTPGSFANNVVASTGGVSGYASANVSGSIASIVVTPGSASILIGRTQQFAAQAYDAAGQPVAGLTYTWTTTAGGTIDQSGLFTAGATPGTFTNNVVAANDGVSGSASASVVSRILDHFVFDTITGPVYASNPFTIRITAYDQLGGVFTPFAGPVQLSDSTGTISPTTTGTFSGGVWSGAVLIANTATSVTIRATDSASGATGVSNAFAVQTGTPDLVVSAVSDPPAAAAPGGTFQVTDTTANQGTGAAAASTTRYYLSLDTAKDGADILLTGTRSVASLLPTRVSTGTVTVTIPTTTALNFYYLIACADDRAVVTESNETNNCRASAARVQVTRPDLVVTAISNPPATVRAGATFQVTDTTANQGLVQAASSRTRYYLSLDTIKNTGDILLTGTRTVPVLAAGASSTGTQTVTVPAATAASLYFVLACADDTALVVEIDETNNCRPSVTQVQVTP